MATHNPKQSVNSPSSAESDSISKVDSALVRFADEPECQEMVQRLARKPNANSTVVADDKSGLYQITESSRALPEKIGRFVIVSQLGNGSFGTVYKAHDPLYDRPVAVKVIHSGKVRNIDRVLNEAKATVKIRDRRIVRAYEVAKDVNGSMYIAMEYVSGGSLRRRMLGGAINYREAVELMESITDAVSIAHSHGFIHRDIKPENILFDNRGNPKIADFGLALSLASDLQDRSEVAGAPPYMSPEQVQGDLSQVDKRSDIWSLGVIFYEMLTGQAPFVGTQSGIFQQIQDRRIVPPQHINQGVPPRVSAICLKCLDRNPAHRFQTASQLVNALYRCKPAEHRTAQQRPAPIRYDMWNSGANDVQLIGISVTLGTIFGIVLTLVLLFLLAMNPENDISEFFRQIWAGSADE